MSETKLYMGCNAIEGDVQYGESSKGTMEIVLQVFVPDLGRTMSTILYFSDSATPHSIERLRVCGWEGEDLSDLKGIGKKKFDFQITTDMYEGKPQIKTNIVSGGGRITTSKVIDAKTFAAKVALLTGKTKAPAGAPPVPFG
jgi:hypothetical protein